MRIIKPRKELRQFVRYYWILKSDTPFNVPTFPIGCTQWIFHKKSPLYIPELDTSQHEFSISGQVNFPAHLKSYGNLEMIVIVFHPHTIGKFLNISSASFYNLEISGYDLGNKELTDLANKVLGVEDHDECIRKIECWLMSHINPDININRIQRVLDSLMINPGLNINNLSEIACLSKRQFERVFHETVGMNPKEYSRVVRFQKALRLMQDGDDNFIGIASDCGYSDQSHFIREFKLFSGIPPYYFLNTVTPYSDLYTTPENMEECRFSSIV